MPQADGRHGEQDEVSTGRDETGWEDCAHREKISSGYLLYRQGAPVDSTLAGFLSGVGFRAGSGDLSTSLRFGRDDKQGGAVDCFRGPGFRDEWLRHNPPWPRKGGAPGFVVLLRG